VDDVCWPDDHRKVSRGDCDASFLSYRAVDVNQWIDGKTVKCPIES